MPPLSRQSLPITPCLSLLHIYRYMDKRVTLLTSLGPKDSQWLVGAFKWDACMFTGSKAVGELVHKALPYSCHRILELGGKCPAILAPDADVTPSLRRILWGKLMNAGQICISPDHLILIGHDINKISQECIEIIKEFYGNNPASSVQYSKIVTQKHLDRLAAFLIDTVHLSIGDSFDRKLAPTLVLNPAPEHPLSKEEVFGPILPIYTADNIEDVVAKINKGDAPLAVYAFAGNAPSRIDNPARNFD